MIARPPEREEDALSADELRLLAEIGFVAARARNGRAALDIFGGLRVVRPDEGFVHVGLAMAHLGGGRPDAAVAAVEDGLKTCAGDPELRVFLGIALREAGRGAEARRVLEALQGDLNAGAGTRRLAASVLQADRRDLPGPVAGGYWP